MGAVATNGLYDAQVYFKNARSAYLIDYRAGLNIPVQNSKRRDGLYEAWRGGELKNAVVGRNFTDCLIQMFGRVNVDSSGIVIPVTPGMCVKGQELFLVTQFRDGMLVENLKYRSMGVERRFAYAKLDQSQRFTGTSGTYWYGYVRTGNYYDIYILDCQKNWPERKHLRWSDLDLYPVDIEPRTKVPRKCMMYTIREIMFC